MSNPSRVFAGVPTGGQFATQAHSEPDLHLSGVEEVREVEPCAGVLARATPEDPAGFCENDAEPGSEYCKRHQGAEPGHSFPYSPGAPPPESTAHTDPAAHMAGMSTSRPPKPGQSLAEKFPTVAAQWHPTRNGDLTPDQVSMGSHTRVWWQCGQGHEVEATVNNRTSNGSGCPVCAGKKVLTGYNDLTTTSPDVARQWHPYSNGDLTPDQVSMGSNKKVWWRCDLGHEWEAEIKARASKGSGCSVCSGRTVLTGYNDLATRFPDVAKQWHPTRNDDRTPDQVSAGTNAKVWWRCEEGHEWETSVNDRTSSGSGCLVCSRRKVRVGFRDLASRFPDIAAQWHPTRNGDHTPDQVLAGTNAKVWWRCQQGHVWEAKVGNRTSGGNGCPVCSGRTVLAGYNDLTTRSPDIAAQWHPTRNGDLRPDQMSAGTNAKVWWRCEEGHEWETRVSNRTSGGDGCPVCSGR